MTSVTALEKMLTLFPEFQRDWDESLFRSESGVFTLHGLFSEFSHFVPDHFGKMSNEKRRELFNFIESCTRSEDELYNELDEAVCTCFLENIAGEPPLSDEMRSYMGHNSRTYFDFWNSPRVSQ